ncbi:MAG: UDP-glucose/GDP-mannose dehydrogenase family protein [Firmicutes bacterium]|nr:UDP-glucose/GDP-mannose dehydrogenase family protein [Bacillota bacterium]
MNICVVGAGYVGLATSAGLSDWGNTVYCVDKDHWKISKLKKGKLTIFEPGLAELMSENIKANRLFFYHSLPRALKNAEIVFLAVQTPPKTNGEVDLSYLMAAAQEVAQALSKDAIIVNKSTAPPGTARKLQAIFDDTGYSCTVVVNPEFLREGSALEDVFHPDRVVIGAIEELASKKIAGLYQHLDTEILQTDWESAELIKYASNGFLAMKISYANALSRLCDKCGANIDMVTVGMGLDKRIGPDFLQAGLGYGGSCFPKDVSALVKWAEDVGYDFKLLKSVQEINATQIDFVLEGLVGTLGEDLAGKHLALLGLAFKPHTDDIRESPALKLAKLLDKKGCCLTGYDPHAMVNVAKVAPFIKLCPDIITTCKGVDAVLVLTDWSDFATLKLSELAEVVRNKVLIDARNLYNPSVVRRCGWTYWSVGRS